jgi:aminoglycoside 6'-N-acetyltransferase
MPGDVDNLCAILAEPSVAERWGAPQAPEDVAAQLRTAEDAVLLVIEIDEGVAGGVQYAEEADPEYRHASIDIYLAERFHGRGLAPEAIHLLAGFLFETLGHHRLTIDPALDNRRAIRAYEKAGFRPVGVMREYELGRDGRFHDGLLMDMLRRDWAASQEGARRS